MMKENPINKFVENAQGETKNQMQRKQNNFGVEHRNRKSIKERTLKKVRIN